MKEDTRKGKLGSSGRTSETEVSASSRHATRTSYYRGMLKVLPPLPAWMEEAACRGAPSEVFFPELNGKPDVRWERAYGAFAAFCESCPVRRECVVWGLEFESAGVWGGFRMENKQDRESARRWVDEAV